MSTPQAQAAALPAGRDSQASWYEASARTRVRLLLDAGSFQEFIGPEKREISPHLRIFDLPEQFDDGMGRSIILEPEKGHRNWKQKLKRAFRSQACL